MMTLMEWLKGEVVAYFGQRPATAAEVMERMQHILSTDLRVSQGSWDMRGLAPDEDVPSAEPVVESIVNVVKEAMAKSGAIAFNSDDNGGYEGPASEFPSANTPSVFRPGVKGPGGDRNPKPARTAGL